MRRVRFIAIATLLVMLSSPACGARWSDAERDAIATRQRGNVALTRDVTRNDDGDAAPMQQATDSPTATTALGATPTGGRTNTVASQSAPCAAASTAPGVTKDEIVVGTISTLSGPRPGFGASAEAGVQAYVAYRNATGGVCGRKIKLLTGDDGFDNAQHRAVTTEFSSKVLGIVGGTALADVGSADVVASKRVPVVTLAISPEFRNVPNVFDLNPQLENVHAPIGEFKWYREHGVRKAAIVYVAADQARNEVRSRQRPLMEAAGFEIVNVQELPTSTLSFDSAARGVANSGADYLFFLHEPGSNVSMARAMADTGYKGLKYAEYFSAYGTDFVEAAGSAAEGATSWIRTLPEEDGGTNAEQRLYLQWMSRAVPGSTRDLFSADSWTSAKAFFDTLTTLKGPITRDTLIAALHAIPTYDAAGFMGPIRFGAERGNGCYIGMHVVGGKWQRLTPATGFLC